MKLINAELVLTMLKAFKDEKYGNPHFMNGIATVIELIEDMPEAVVRCEDCLYNYGNAEDCEYNQNDIVCTYFDTDGMDASGFCSYGERRTDETKRN